MISNILSDLLIYLAPYIKYIIPLSQIIIVVIAVLVIRNRGYKIEKNYTKSTATVISVEKGSDCTYVRYEFHDNCGLTHSKEASTYHVDKNLYEGANITVYYKPTAPNISYPDFKVKKYKLTPITTALAILLGLLMFYFSHN